MFYYFVLVHCILKHELSHLNLSLQKTVHRHVTEFYKLTKNVYCKFKRIATFFNKHLSFYPILSAQQTPTNVFVHLTTTFCVLVKREDKNY